MNAEATCSHCRFWDFEHAQQTELDDEYGPARELYARCMNPKSRYEGSHIAANDTCGAFEER